VIKDCTNKLKAEVEETNDRMIEFELEREELMQQNMKFNVKALYHDSLCSPGAKEARDKE